MGKFYRRLRSTQIKTGIWTLVILLILILGYLWLTNRLNMKSQQEISVVFDDIMGLEVGDKIMYRGMEAGRIKSVGIHPEGIICTGSILSSIKIPESSKFYIEDSLMGSKSMRIVPSDNPRLMDTRVVQRGESPMGMMMMISAASATLARLDEVVSALNAEGGLLRQGETLLSGAAEAVDTSKRSITELKQDISATINRVEQITRQISSVLADNKDNLETAVSMAPDAIARVNNTLDSLQALSGKLNTSALKLATGSGTAGKMLSDAELYNKLLLSIENLDALVKDVRANPRKYVKFSLF